MISPVRAIAIIIAKYSHTISLPISGELYTDAIVDAGIIISIISIIPLLSVWRLAVKNKLQSANDKIHDL